MKKIFCEAYENDWVRVELGGEGSEVWIDTFTSICGMNRSVSIMLSPEKIRKLRKQLKRALIEIEGVSDESP